jgi:hypothetical protein
MGDAADDAREAEERLEEMLYDHERGLCGGMNYCPWCNSEVLDMLARFINAARGGHGCRS